MEILSSLRARQPQALSRCSFKSRRQLKQPLIETKSSFPMLKLPLHTAKIEEVAKKCPTWTSSKSSRVQIWLPSSQVCALTASLAASIHQPTNHLTTYFPSKTTLDSRISLTRPVTLLEWQILSLVKLTQPVLLMRSNRTNLDSF